MVSCTTIEAQIVFKMLLALITGQLTIAGQLGSKVHLWKIELFLRRWVCLILGDQIGETASAPGILR